MIDIHCHLLSGLDDGARSLAESLEIMREAHRAGVTQIVATPHSSSFKRDPRTQTISNEIVQLLDAAADDPEASAVCVVPGAEIMLDPDVRKLLDLGELPALGADATRGCHPLRCVLVELPMAMVPSWTHEVLFDLAAYGYTPILAHPERNHELSQDLDMMLTLIRQGTLMQIDAGSVVGAYGPIAKENAFMILEHRLCHFVASDAHRPGFYTRIIPGAMRAVAESLGDEAMYALFSENADAILGGNMPGFPDPIPFLRGGRHSGRSRRGDQGIHGGSRTDAGRGTPGGPLGWLRRGRG